MYYGGFENSQFHPGVTLPLHRHLPPHYRPPYHFPLPVPGLTTEQTVTPRQPVSFVSHVWKSTVKVIHWLVEKTGRSDKAKFLWEGSGRNRILLMELITDCLRKTEQYTVHKVDFHSDFRRILVWDSPTLKLSYVEKSVFPGYSTAIIGTLRSNDGTATRTSLKKWICVLSVFIAIIPTHLLCQL